MSDFEVPLNDLESLIIRAEIWQFKVDYSPTYYKKHSADQAYRYRNTPAVNEEVWCPDFH